MSRPYLVVDSVDKYFGGVRALHKVSFAVERGQVMGLIGPNGSGKSTMINVISGVFPPSAGSIFLNDQPLAGVDVNNRVAMGLGRTFQTTNVFPEFTVGDQLLAACHTRYKTSPVGSVFRRRVNREEEREQERKVRKLLEFVGLDGTFDLQVSSISSAQQRLLMIATALAGEPGAIMLDEPAAGMIASERQGLIELVRKIRDSGIGVLVVEHHMALIMEVCDRITVLNFGEKIAEDTPEAITNNQLVCDAYLGQTD